MRYPFFSSATIAAVMFGLSVASPAAEDKRRPADKADTTLSKQDRRFIEKAMQDNQAEVALAKVAQEKASSDAVKQYARKLHEDHSKAAQELEAIASRLGYAESRKAEKEPRAVKKFAKMQGDKFDRAFAKHMVDDHEKAIKLFKKQAQDGNSQELWQYAQKNLPTLEQHLKMARELAGETPRKGRKES